MPSTDQNAVVVAGDNPSIQFTVSDASGNVYSMSGATVRWGLARSPFDTAIIEKSTSSGVAISGSSNEIATITLSTTDTVGLVGNHYHELQITDLSNNVITAAVGEIRFLPGLIR